MKLDVPDPPPDEVIVELVRSRLGAVSSAKTVGDVYDQFMKLLASESARAAAIDQKAGSLLTVVGFVLTVGLTFATGWFQSTRDFGDLEKAVQIVLVAFSALTGLACAGLAVAAAKVREFEDPSMEELLHEKTLRSTEDLSEEDYAQAVYRRFIAAHLSGIIARNKDVLAAKSLSLGYAQLMFVVFLALVGGLAVSITFLFALHSSQ